MSPCGATTATGRRRARVAGPHRAAVPDLSALLFASCGLAPRLMFFDEQFHGDRWLARKASSSIGTLVYGQGRHGSARLSNVSAYIF